MLVSVQGGTNAGRKIVREPRKAFWVHECSVTVTRGLESCYTHCPYCGTKRR